MSEKVACHAIPRMDSAVGQCEVHKGQSLWRCKAEALENALKSIRIIIRSKSGKVAPFYAAVEIIAAAALSQLKQCPHPSTRRTTAGRIGVGVEVTCWDCGAVGVGATMDEACAKLEEKTK